MPAAMAMHDRMIRFRSSSRCSMKPIVPLPRGSSGFSGTRARGRLAMVVGFYGEPRIRTHGALHCVDRSTIVIVRRWMCDAKQYEARRLSGLCAAGMAALAPQLGLLTFFLTVLAAVFAPWSAFGDHTGAGGMRAFLGVRHLTPPGAGVILLTFRSHRTDLQLMLASNRTDEFSPSVCESVNAHMSSAVSRAYAILSSHPSAFSADMARFSFALASNMHPER